jgi:1,4-alpha-glucan branching enzyme
MQRIWDAAPANGLCGWGMSRLSSPGVALDRLPVDVRGGVHLDFFSPGSATFVLYAPFKPYVALVGDFNDWNTRANRMITDGLGVWWTTIPHPGPARYGFYVAIDDQAHVWVGDPYATAVDWSGRTPWGIVPTTANGFAWSDQRWQTPPLRDLVIYELCVRDFAGSWQANRPHYGNFRELIHYIPYLAELGVNAVELMPIQAFPGESSWGYNPVFYFALASTYGTPTECKQFVDECHRAGIAVILDVAFNHAWGEHPYYQMYPAMYGEAGERLTDWNPFFHHTPPSVNMWGGVDWDHFTLETTRYFQDIVRFWLQEYHVDGFRFDWAAGVDYDSRNPMRGDFDPYHGISAICWAARQAKPDCLLLAEYWPLEGTSEAKSAARLTAETPMDACWNGLFHHTLDDVLNQRWAWEKEDIFRALGGFRDQGYSRADQTITYSCSHDEVRPEHEIKFYSWPHIERPPGMSVQALALAKGLLGLIALFAMPGVPMLYAGQEFAEDGPRTIDFQPLHWGKLIQPAHAEHKEVVKRLVQARRRHAALRGDHIEFYVDNFSLEQVVRCKRWADTPDAAEPGDYATAALNFGGRARRVVLEVPRPGSWYDVVGNQHHTTTGNTVALELPPWSGVLLTQIVSDA